MNKTKKIGMYTLVLMIFTSVFGFTNISRSFYLMGYGAIPWYIISGILFFIPYAFMMTEFGAAFKDEKGGIYSWMEKSVGSKFAFLGTFMWYTSNIIWMVSVASSIWVPASNFLFGSDKTQEWELLGLSGSKLLGILGIILIITITYISTKGLKNISKIASIGGIFVTIANILLLVGGIIVLVGNGFTPAEPINFHAFVSSPNKNYTSIIGMASFMVFALFSYGGLEVVSGLVDEAENPIKNFPKAIKLSAIIISVGYCIAILFVGFFTNWNSILTVGNVNMANVAYIVLNNLGIQIGNVLGFSQGNAVILGNFFARFIGLSMLLALTGAFFTVIYSPIKQLIEGTPNKIWPKSWTKINKNNMPTNAMWIQCAVVVIIIALSAFGGKSASKFLDYLILMGNVSMTIPYMFLSIAFIYFKKKEYINKPIKIFKSYKSGAIWGIIVTFIIGFANIFTIIQPIIEENDYFSTVLQVAGPILFVIIGLVLYARYKKKNKFKYVNINVGN